MGEGYRYADRYRGQVNIWSRILGFIELVRPHNLVVSLLTTLIGYIALARDVNASEIVWSHYLAAASVVVLVAAGGYVINDYYDVATDAIAKPWRPIVSGRVSRRAARLFAYILFLSGLAVSFALYYREPIIPLYAVLNTFLVHEYSRWIKRTGFLGNIVIAFNSASSIVFGYLVACYAYLGRVVLRVYPLIPAIYAFLLVLGREVVKGIEDVKGDRVAGIKTIAARFGVSKAVQVSAILLSLVIVLSPVPYIVGLFNMYYMLLALIVDALIILSLWILFKSSSEDQAIESSRRARSLLKWAFMVGALAFILGSI